MRVRTGARGAHLVARVAATSVVLGTLGVIGLSAVSGPAQAGERQPEITVGPSFPGPGITIDTVSPTFTLPPFTLVTVPPTATVETTTTVEPTTTTAPTETTEATDTTAATETTEPGDDDGPSAPTGTPEQYTVDVTFAVVECDGTIHVEFDTVASPQPETASNHLVVFNPASNPVDFHVVETKGNPANGSFEFEDAGSVEDSYRVYVIAQFDAVNPDGPVAVDHVDVLPATECP